MKINIWAIPLFLSAATAISFGTSAFAADDHDDHEHAKEKTKIVHSNDDGHDHGTEKTDKKIVHSNDDGHDHGTEKTDKKIVHSNDDGHDHGTEKTDKKKEEPPVHLSPEQRKLIQIKIEKAEGGELENIIRLSGEIRLNLDETARIMPRMPGFVTEVKVREGQLVKHGQLLAKMTSHKLGEYYSAFNSASELEKLTLSEFQMAERLRDKKAIAEKEYLRYKREYADAGIERRRAEAMLKSLLLDPAHPGHGHSDKNGICTEYEIRAPFNGTVTTRDITVGENFAEDNTRIVFTVSNLNELWLNLRATSSELKTLKTGLPVTVIPASSKTEYHGKIIFISPVIDEATRTGLVRVLLDNRTGQLRPGEFATGVVKLDSKGKLVLIPRDAVQLVAGETVVFVPQGDGFAPKVVAVGKTAKGFIQISSGLKPGDAYVSEGAFELKSVLLTSGIDPHAGHGH